MTQHNDEHDERAATATTTEQPRRARLSLYTIVASSAVASLGNSLTAIAIPWFVLVTTGSAARTGIVAVAGLLPVIISGFIGGAFVDRIGFKRASVISDIASGVTVAMIPTLYLLDVLAFWHLFTLAFLGALLDVPGMTARRAMVPKLAGHIGMPLERINAAYQLAVVGSSVAGPLAAGLLIASVGAASVLYINTATFAFSALAVAFGVSYPRLAAAVASAAGAARKQTALRDALDGLRFLFRDQLQAAIMTASVVANFLFAPLFAVVFPVFAKNVFDDPRALGYLVASFGAGSILSTIGYGAVGARLQRFHVFVFGVLLAAAGLWLLPWSSQLWLSVGAGFTVGFAVAPINALAMVVLQERVPENMLGRALGTVFAMSQLAAPLGVLVAGLATEAFGVRFVLAAIATGFSILTVWILINPAFRTMERPETPSPAEGVHVPDVSSTVPSQR